MNTCSDEKVIASLQTIAEKNQGILRPEDVVDAARDEKSPLHSKFEWDDSAAAHQYRLCQARHLINVSVKYIELDKEQVPVRVFVSLTPDRQNPGGGYRPISTVMSDAQLRRQLLDDARDEMILFEKKYHRLKELKEVFAAMRKTCARYSAHRPIRQVV
jgi:hypothetical protein